MEIVQFELTVEYEYSSALESECFNEQLRCIDFFTHFMFPYALFVSQLNLSDVDTSDIVLLKEG